MMTFFREQRFCADLGNLLTTASLACTTINKQEAEVLHYASGLWSLVGCSSSLLYCETLRSAIR